MKNTISVFVVILFFTTLSHAQNQSLFKTDTTAIGKLGFSKKNLWQLPLKDSVIVQHFDFHSLKNDESNVVTYFDNMPIFRPESNRIMPVQVLDTKARFLY